MALRLVFLGRLVDVAGSSEREVAGTPTLADLFQELEPSLANALADQRIRLAHNGEIVARESLVLKDGDELAFLPPVSGG